MKLEIREEYGILLMGMSIIAMLLLASPSDANPENIATESGYEFCTQTVVNHFEVSLMGGPEGTVELGNRAYQIYNVATHYGNSTLSFKGDYLSSISAEMLTRDYAAMEAKKEPIEAALVQGCLDSYPFEETL